MREDSEDVNAMQMLVIAIIMPMIVRDIGGASFYTWAAMLCTIGAIVVGASTGMVWSRLGTRRFHRLLMRRRGSRRAHGRPPSHLLALVHPIFGNTAAQIAGSTRVNMTIDVDDAPVIATCAIDR